MFCIDSVGSRTLDPSDELMDFPDLKFDASAKASFQPLIRNQNISYLIWAPIPLPHANIHVIDQPSMLPSRNYPAFSVHGTPLLRVREYSSARRHHHHHQDNNYLGASQVWQIYELSTSTQGMMLSSNARSHRQRALRNSFKYWGPGATICSRT